MCGEYSNNAKFEEIKKGSPPHVWRILLGQLITIAFLGITSTCVENTFRTIGVAKNIRDHLHMCGEYHTRLKSPSRIVGSPPHVWRIPSVISIETVNIRITSTCVENTIPLHNGMLRERGSPPHVWRIQNSHVRRPEVIGITSTCVENTLI